jgi:hypothetical protein
MAILKLTPGLQNAVSGTIDLVDLDTTGKFGPQYKVTFTSGDLVYLPKDGFERQAARLQLLPNELGGKDVTFWKKPMADDPTGTKGFLNIDLGIRAGSANTTPVATYARNDDNVGRELRNHGIPVSATTYEDIKDKYTACLGDAVAILNDAAETLGVTFTPAEIMASTATLFIERNRRGV